MARASWAGVTEVDLLEKCRANARIQPHVLGFIEATDKAGYVLDLYDKCVAGGGQCRGGGQWRPSLGPSSP